MVNTLVNVPGEVVGQAGVRLTAKTTGPIMISGPGNPNGVVSATIGSMFLRTDVASLYQNLDGATAWTQVSGGSGIGAGAFGSWYSNVATQTSTTSGVPVTLNNTVGASGISLVGGDTLSFAATGWYNLQYSLQVTNAHTQLEDVNVWLELNGSPVPDTDSGYTIPERHGMSVSGRLVAAVNYVLYVIAGSSIKLIWSNSRPADVELTTIPVGSPAPVSASPAAIVTVTPVDGGGFRQAFVYTATGLEGSPFTIPLPFARNNTNYVAQVTGGGMAAQRTFDVILASNTVNDISVVPSGGLTAGDKLVVVAQDLT